MAKKHKGGRLSVPLFILLAVAVIVVGLYYYDVPPLDFDLNIGFKHTQTPSDDTEIEDPVKKEDFNDGDIYVHFIDVGQGDSILLRFPDNKSMLIDGGSFNDAYVAIAEVLTTYNISELDYVMLTHTDRDHCGALSDVVESSVLAKKVYMPYVRSKSVIDPITTGKADIPELLKDIISLESQTYGYISTVAYESFVNAVLEDNAQIEYSLQGEVIEGEGYSITFYTPTPELYRLVKKGESEDINNVSPIMVLEYNGRKVMFTGDVASSGSSHNLGAEGVFLDYVQRLSANVDVDVLKVAHHGSRGSSCNEFLRVVKPEYAVISAGVDNSYGHPHSETLNRLAAIGADIYCTADLGNITLVIDKDGQMSFSFERQG